MKTGYLTTVKEPDGEEDTTFYIYTDEPIDDLYDYITRENLVDMLDELGVEYSIIFPDRVSTIELEIME